MMGSCLNLLFAVWPPCCATPSMGNLIQGFLSPYMVMGLRLAVLRSSAMTKAASELFTENNSYRRCSLRFPPISRRLIWLGTIPPKKLFFYNLTYLSVHKFTRQRVPSLPLAKTRAINTFERKNLSSPSQSAPL